MAAVPQHTDRAGLCECAHVSMDHAAGRCLRRAATVTACERLLCEDCLTSPCLFCGAVAVWLDDGTNTHHRPLHRHPLDLDELEEDQPVTNSSLRNVP